MKKIRKYFQENEYDEKIEWLEKNYGIEEDDLHNDLKSECLMLECETNENGDFVDGAEYKEVRQIAPHLYYVSKGRFNCSQCWVSYFTSNKVDALSE